MRRAVWRSQCGGGRREVLLLIFFEKEKEPMQRTVTVCC
jgi:hypothetical protein